MLEQTQISRLAAMGNELRPDWPNASLFTFIAKNLSNRAYRDVAVALAYVATDPETNTPARMLEAGPWWLTTRVAGTSTPIRRLELCAACHTKHLPDSPCGNPRKTEHVAEALLPAREALEAARADLCKHGVPYANCLQHDAGGAA